MRDRTAWAEKGKDGFLRSERGWAGAGLGQTLGELSHFWPLGWVGIASRTRLPPALHHSDGQAAPGDPRHG